MSKRPNLVKGWRYNQDEHHHEVASAEHGEDAKMPTKSDWLVKTKDI